MILLTPGTHLTESSTSAEQTEAFGAALAEQYLKRPGELPGFLALYGDLGVGKTAFVRGFASRFVPGSAVRSPTFTLVNEYRKEGRTLYHFDLYRITDDDDLYSTGFYDFLEDGRGVCIAEWCENIPWAVPADRLTVRISKVSPEMPELRTLELHWEHPTICTCRNN
jgi:tRNA threonylcarbamoyladenosine biosynthesis protein TsaE